MHLVDPTKTKASFADVSKLAEEQFDIGIVASFGLMLPSKLIDSFSKGVFVMHPSLLPLYRGACPIQHALLDGRSFTGVSIASCSKNKFDAGKVFLQEKVEIKPYFRFSELSVKLSEVGSEKVFEFIQNYDSLISAGEEQDESKVTPAPKLGDKPYLDFKASTCSEIVNKYRAFFGSNQQPFTNFTLESKTRFIFFDNLFKVTENSPMFTRTLANADYAPGSIFWNLKTDREFIFFKASDGWVCSNKIKFDCTGWNKADFFIAKYLKNKKFDSEGNIKFSTLYFSS